MTPFTAGQAGKLGGVRYRVVTGKKEARIGQDLRLDICAPQFTPVKISLIGLCYEFLYRNEERLYPPPQSGGDRVDLFLKGCLYDGWESAHQLLEVQREMAAKRRAA